MTQTLPPSHRPAPPAAGPVPPPRRPNPPAPSIPPTAPGWGPGGWSPPLPPPPPPPPPPGWAASPPPGAQLPPPPAPPSAWAVPNEPARPVDGGISLQNLLLATGTTLVAIAAVVFMAVSWDRLDATTQGLVLVGLTVLAGLGTRTLARRRLPATAEALGLVTVLLALADAHALRIGLDPQLAGTTWWAGAVGLVAAGAWVLGRATEVRSTRVAAAGLAQVPLPVLLAGTDLGPTLAASLLLAQVAVVVALVTRSGRALPAGRAFAASVAAVTWTTVAAGAVVAAPFADDGDRPGVATLLALAGAVAALVAARRAPRDEERVLGLITATGLGLLATLVAALAWVAGDLVLPVVALVAVAVVAGGVRAARRWGGAPAVVGATVAALASMPILGVVGTTLIAAGSMTTEPWTTGAGARAAAALGDADLLSSRGLGLHLVVLAALALAAAPVVGRRRSLGALAGVAGATVVVAPYLVPLSTGGSAAVALLGASLATAVVASTTDAGRRAVGGVLAGVLASFGGLWATAAELPSLVAAWWIALLALALAAAGRRQRDLALATTAGSIAVLAASVAVGVSTAVSGVGGQAPLAAGALAAVVLGLLAGLLLDPAGTRRDLDGIVGTAAEIVAGGVHLWALVVLASSGDARGTSVVLASGTVAAALHAARPGRRGLAVVAVAEGLALSWWQLDLAGVTAVEAYTVPLAAVLLGAGLWAERIGARRSDPSGRFGPRGSDSSTAPVSSWVTLGPGLVVALAPTVLLGLGDPGLVRPLGGLVAGAVVLAAGAVSRRRAAVDVGIAVIVLLGLRQLAPVVGSLPSWVTVGSTGLALLALGATFEQRRRDLHEVKDRYSSLR